MRLPVWILFRICGGRSLCKLPLQLGVMLAGIPGGAAMSRGRELGLGPRNRKVPPAPRESNHVSSWIDASFVAPFSLQAKVPRVTQLS